MADKELTQLEPITSEDIKSRIYTVRGVQVMLDSDLAEFYRVETRILNQAVKRNAERFPSDFYFQLSEEEFINLKSQIVISSETWGGIRKLPHVFTEHGVTMLSTLLRSDIAIKVSLAVIRAFVAMRHYLADNAVVFQRLDRIELKQIDTDNKVNQIFKQLEQPKADKAVIFYNGQMWDAVKAIEDIIAKAEEEVILIDNYIDRRTLDLLSKKGKDVKLYIYTSMAGNTITVNEQDTFEKQYGKLKINIADKFHDRFMILDNKVMYHVGASIKDAGKKVFAISVIDDMEQLNNLKSRLKG